MKQEHKVFINEYLATGDKYHAYKKAYPDAGGEALRTAARRLLRVPEIKKAVLRADAAATEKATELLEQTRIEQLESELTSIRKKRAILARMIDGEYKVKRCVKLKDHIETVEDDLNPYALLRAMELDTKLAKEEYELTRLKIHEEAIEDEINDTADKKTYHDTLQDGYNQYKEQREQEKAESHTPSPGWNNSEHSDNNIPDTKPRHTRRGRKKHPGR